MIVYSGHMNRNVEIDLFTVAISDGGNTDNGFSAINRTSLTNYVVFSDWVPVAHEYFRISKNFHIREALSWFNQDQEWHDWMSRTEIFTPKSQISSKIKKKLFGLIEKSISVTLQFQKQI